MSKFGAAVAALALTAAFSSAAMAAPVDLTACTKDGKSVTLKIDVDGGIKNGPTLAAISQQAFTEAASEQTAAELTASPAVFMKHLQADVLAAVGDKGEEAVTEDFSFNGFPSGAPVAGGNCTVPAPASR
jgi:hypothetical protein